MERAVLKWKYLKRDNSEKEHLKLAVQERKLQKKDNSEQDKSKKENSSENGTSGNIESEKEESEKTILNREHRKIKNNSEKETSKTG